MALASKGGGTVSKSRRWKTKPTEGNPRKKGRKSKSGGRKSKAVFRLPI
jgi:hypothetical protein